MVKRMLQFLMCGVFLSVLAGCGSGSLSTNGTLTLADITVTDLTNGKYYVSTSATFVSGTGKVLPGTEITYTATFAGSTTKTIDGFGPTDSSGTFIIIPTPEIIQDTVPIIVTIVAKTGGLSATKVASIPGI